MATLEHRLAVRDEHAVDGELQQGREGVAELGVTHSGREPRLGAHADAARRVAEKDVPRDERGVHGEPEHDLRRAAARQGLDARRQPVARPEHADRSPARRSIAARARDAAWSRPR